MTDHPQSTKLIFKGGFDEREAFEAQARGYRSHVTVELCNGQQFAVVFEDPVRLTQDLQDEANLGSAFIAELGLIVVPEVTLEFMEKAVAKLAQEGYFDSLRTLEEVPHELSKG